MSVNLIVAMDAQRGIGLAQRMPWHLPEELRHFKNTTLGHTVVMGRKTYESLPGALKDRRQIVVSRTHPAGREGLSVVPSLEQALSLATKSRREQVFVIGGGQIYWESMRYVSRLIVTHLPEVYGCDTFFPEIDPGEWRETSRRHEYSVAADLDYQISVYERMSAAAPIPPLKKALS